MRNFLKAALVVSFLVPAVSFADAPKKDTAAAKDSKDSKDAKAAPKTDAKTDAKATDSKAKDTKAAPKTDAKTDAKKPAAK